MLEKTKKEKLDISNFRMSKIVPSYLKMAHIESESLEALTLKRTQLFWIDETLVNPMTFEISEMD